MSKTLKQIGTLYLLSYLVTACAGIGTTKNIYKGDLSHDQLNEIALLIEITEKEPTSARADELRTQLSIWLVNSPDVTVRIYNTLELSDNYHYKALFTTQAMLLSAKHIIRQPELEKEYLTIQIQTLHGLLDIYEQIVALEGEPAKDPALERLLIKRADGTLDEHVQAIVSAVGDG